MSVQYSAIKWNANKRRYDAILVAGIVAYLALFILAGKLLWRGERAISDPILVMRALGTCAFVLLHVILCIGPLARLDRRFLPLLYNRRHLGVATFLIGLCHALIAIGFYHGFGTLNPFVSLLTSNTRFDSLTAFPFELLGLLALVILFVMAATSHDFWQKNLGPSFWKTLHMAVYPAYGFLVMHVALGALQTETGPVMLGLLLLGVVTVLGLQLLTGWREARRDASPLSPVGKEEKEWVEVGTVDEIPESRAKTVCLEERERVAVFRYDGCISAVTNVCAHQRGPLGEGKIIDGCITCPWHGWEYRPETGQSPPPFHEKIATYEVRVEGRRILLNPDPHPPGTPVDPARFTE